MEPSGQAGNRPGGLAGHFRRIGATLLGTLHNRIELFGVELHEERLWYLTTVIWAAALVFFSICAITLVTVTVALLAPPEARPIVLVGLCVLYLGLALAAGLGLRKRIQEKPPAFNETAAELKKDAAWLRPPE
jgi:uncharacterized membrane protein YqjE